MRLALFTASLSWLASVLACESRVQVLEPKEIEMGSAGSGEVDAGAPASCGTCGTLELCAVDHCVDISGVTALGSGLRHVCVVQGARLFCWGGNGSSQLGLGDEEDRLEPTPVGAIQEWLEIAAGQEHTCALRAPGALYCWGENSVGQLGLGDLLPRNVPTLSAAPTDFTRIACGGDNCCALRESGALYCWGDNHEGNPGQADAPGSADLATPSPVSPGMAFVRVAVGEAHSCAIRKDGALHCWGRNNDGQLGIGSEPTQLREPARVGRLRGWREVSAGQHHTCAIRGEGELYCWGSNDFFELGRGSGSLDDETNVVSEPLRVGTDTDWSSVAVGWFHSCALKRSGALYCWGRSQEGQLGNGAGDPVPAPTQSAPSMRFRKIALGSFHTCALDAERKVYCWGANINGQLGVNDKKPRDMPARAPL